MPEAFVESEATPTATLTTSTSRRFASMKSNVFVLLIGAAIGAVLWNYKATLWKMVKQRSLMPSPTAQSEQPQNVSETEDDPQDPQEAAYDPLFQPRTGTDESESES